MASLHYSVMMRCSTNKQIRFHANALGTRLFILVAGFRGFGEGSVSNSASLHPLGLEIDNSKQNKSDRQRPFPRNRNALETFSWAASSGTRLESPIIVKLGGLHLGVILVHVCPQRGSTTGRRPFDTQLSRHISLLSRAPLFLCQI